MKDIILNEKWYKIGAGDTAECFASRDDDGVLLKLFFDRFSKETVEKEFLSSKTAERFFNGPATRDLVCVDGRFGILFDRIHGIALTKACEQDPGNIRKYAELYVDELKKTHAVSIEGEQLPSMSAIHLDAIDHFFKSEKWKKAFRDIVAILEKEFPKDVLLHGDRHPGNVLLEDGKPVWIDLGYISKGPAVYDLASLYLIWIEPVTSFFIPSAASLKLEKPVKKEFYDIVVRAFAEMNHKTDIAHVNWLIRQSTILFVILSLYREGCGEFKFPVLNEIMNGILKAMTCLLFLWHKKER